MVEPNDFNIIYVGLVDNLLEYLKFDDDDVRLAAARSFRFLSGNPNIKPKLKAISSVTTTMVLDNEWGLICSWILA